MPALQPSTQGDALAPTHCDDHSNGHRGQWSDGYLQIAQQAGLNPVLVDYNSGLPIAQNAAAFADLMTDLVAAEPAVERIVFIAHSMGGLIVTAAIDAAAQPIPDADSTDWRSLVTDVVTLGTPHEGAPLERVSDFALRAASRWPTAVPIANLGHFRSQGIKDRARAALRASQSSPGASGCIDLDPVLLNRRSEVGILQGNGRDEIDRVAEQRLQCLLEAEVGVEAVPDVVTELDEEVDVARRLVEASCDGRAEDDQTLHAVPFSGSSDGGAIEHEGPKNDALPPLLEVDLQSGTSCRRQPTTVRRRHGCRGPRQLAAQRPRRPAKGLARASKERKPRVATFTALWSPSPQPRSRTGEPSGNRSGAGPE